MIPGTYNNNVQLVQTRDYVVLQTEMVHEARIIPLDGRPHGTLPRWLGDSRGRWEGDTLVVETINFRRETALRGSSATDATGRALHACWPRHDLLRVHRPIRRRHAAVDGGEPLTRTDELMYEYACHEGNYRHDRHPSPAPLL